MSKKALNLPAELEQLVLKNLKLPKPLFRPQYGKVFETNYSDEGSLKDKYRLYWGPDRSKEQNEAVLTVLNLARTSQHYADLLDPLIYETVVVRPTGASLDFVRSIQQTPKWGMVRHLVICNVYRVIDDPEREYKEGISKPDLLEYGKAADIEEGIVLAHNLGQTPKLDAATQALKETLEDSSSAETDTPKTEKGKQSEINHADDPYNGYEYDPDPTRNINFEAYAAILENLPPNLQKLTIDTPTDWFECFEDGEYLSYFVHETAEELLKNEQESVFRKQIYTVYKALCSEHNLDSLRKSSAAHGFELKILNFPPFSCSLFPGATEYPCAKRPNQDTKQNGAKKKKKFKAKEAEQQQRVPPDAEISSSSVTTPKLAELLSLATSFKISGIWWDNGAGWHMNTHEHMQAFPASMPTFMFNHLSDKCEKFVFEGDKSWILGDYRSGYTSMNPLPLDTEGYTVASAYGPREIPMPGFSAEACNNVKDVEISNIMAGTEFLNFYKARVATIETLKLRGCWIFNTTWPPENDTQFRTWATFLRALAREVGQKLTSVEISYDAEDTARMRDDSSRYDEGWAQRDDLLSFAVSTSTTNRSGRTRSSKSAQQDKEKFQFGYGSVSDKYGDLFPDDEASEESFKEGEDWKAWLELVDIVQKNSQGTRDSQ